MTGMETVLIAELASGLCIAAIAVGTMIVAAAVVLGRGITLDAEQREPVRYPTTLPARYVPRVRGSRTSRTASPRMLTARIRPNNAVDAAARFQPMIGSRASSSRA